MIVRNVLWSGHRRRRLASHCSAAAATAAHRSRRITSVDPAATQQTAVCRRRRDDRIRKRRKRRATDSTQVETLRQNDGLSGTLYNVPMIIGPTTFRRSRFDARPAAKCRAPATIWAPTTSRGERSINRCGPDRARGLKQHRRPARSVTASAPATPTRDRSTAPTPLYQAYNLPIYGNDRRVAGTAVRRHFRRPGRR